MISYKEKIYINIYFLYPTLDRALSFEVESNDGCSLLKTTLKCSRASINSSVFSRL